MTSSGIIMATQYCWIETVGIMGTFSTNRAVKIRHNYAILSFASPDAEFITPSHLGAFMVNITGDVRN